MPSKTVMAETPALTTDQAGRLLGSVRSDCADSHLTRRLAGWRDFCGLAPGLRMALRQNEILSLCWRNFRESDGSLTLEIMGKGNKPATVRVPTDLALDLRAWKSAFETGTGLTLLRDDPILVAIQPAQIKKARLRSTGQSLPKLSANAFYTLVTNRLADIGIDGPRFSPHCLRATAATLALEAGAQIEQVQKLLRHASIETTRVYLRRLEQAGERAMEAISIDFATHMLVDPPTTLEDDPAA